MSEKMELEEFGREEMRFTICRDFFWRQDLIAIGVDKTGDLSVREHSRVDPEVVRRVWVLLREVVEQHFEGEAALAKLKKKASRRSPNGERKGRPVS